MPRRLFLAAVLAVAIAIAAAACGSEPRPALDPVNVVEAAPTASPDEGTRPPEPAKRAARPGVPVQIEIPAIGVRAPVIKLGLNRDGSLEVPTPLWRHRLVERRVAPG